MLAAHGRDLLSCPSDGEARAPRMDNCARRHNVGADYEIMDLRTKEFVDPGGPMQLADATVEATIVEFLQRVLDKQQ